MNAIAMLLQQLPATIGEEMTKQANAKESLANSPFQELMIHHQMLSETGNQLFQMGEEQMDTADLLPVLDGKTLVAQYVSNLVSPNQPATLSIEEQTNVLKMLEQPFIQQSLLDPNNEISEHGEIPEAEKLSEQQGEVEDGELNLAFVQQQLATIFSDVEAILAQVHSKQDITKVATKLMELLKQWNAVMKNAEAVVSPETTARLQESNTKEHAIWQRLVQAFQKRENFAQKQPYNREAKVSSVDVAKWLTKAIETVSKTEHAHMGNKETMIVAANSSSVPLDKMQQHVIYLNPGQHSQKQIGQELIQQFQRIMKTSRFMKMPNGVNQLRITLRPQHLGDLLVRFTELNGEMTVRILVQSQAAKDLLESNIHKLRNMFSPQQVVIERQEAQLTQGQQLQKDSGESPQQFTDHEQDNQHESEREDTNSEGEFASTFQEILLNEQV
ncbi:flagellar hook-length control protein FliK [Virgibacillus proomii]|uniref:flagellar hook-length control protein FliK n=1 Tax=Virgibacillus proomii TaxID=84407 RepID=UPI001C104ABF|nr:flagellar hook-length control protein FliK [Virgibacillus proomii]MBU5267796.1 flagellar hook-length control protein FliK [Virgibacillus proomii]